MPDERAALEALLADLIRIDARNPVSSRAAPREGVKSQLVV